MTLLEHGMIREYEVLWHLFGDKVNGDITHRQCRLNCIVAYMHLVNFA
jgi:hypothetical protein